MHAFEGNLTDGRRVRLRPIWHGDEALIQARFRRLSARSRHLRGDRPLRQGSETDVQLLTSADGVNRVAWGALALDEPRAPGVGAARYVRDPSDPAVAEAAVAVVDDYQGAGLGRLLLGTLIVTALENGVERLVGRVLPANDRAMRLLEAAGGVPVGISDGLVMVEIPISGHLKSSQPFLRRPADRPRPDVIRPNGILRLS
jgi:GNAT superfamily N-acetyltransferase